MDQLAFNQQWDQNMQIDYTVLPALCVCVVGTLFLFPILFLLGTFVLFVAKQVQSYWYRATRTSTERVEKSGWAISRHLSRSNIGVNFNKWKRPTCQFGSGEEWMEQQLEDTFGQFNIPDMEWIRATTVVESVLEMLFVAIQKEAATYEGLVVEQYIRQGSSREGLKVGQADEFDTLLQFHIDGLQYELDPIKSSSGEVLPELTYLIVTDDIRWLKKRFPKLDKCGIFLSGNDGRTYLNSRRLHERVFTSIIDTACLVVSRTITRPADAEKFGFRIRRRMNPPSINIIIEVIEKDDEFDVFAYIREQGVRYGVRLEAKRAAPIITEIDVDIVPGLLLQNDVVPDPSARGQTMNCPRYAVSKWVTDNHPSASRYVSPDAVWRNCSSGYEKHFLDVAQGSTEQRYIITAVRIAKAYFRWRKSPNCGIYGPPPQIVTVLRSYHLKHIGFYCILYLTVLNKVNLSGVREALAYLLEFLSVCLEERRLPHFFHANAWIHYMFPDYKVEDKLVRYDLFLGKRGDSLNQAWRSFGKEMRQDLMPFYDKSNIYEDFKDTFREYLVTGQYYS